MLKCAADSDLQSESFTIRICNPLLTMFTMKQMHEMAFVFYALQMLIIGKCGLQNRTSSPNGSIFATTHDNKKRLSPTR